MTSSYSLIIPFNRITLKGLQLFSEAEVDGDEHAVFIPLKGTEKVK